MKISRDWLQTYFKEPLPGCTELAEALTFHAFEIESIENDVLDVKVTPNRGHDALSHRGVAKEIAAILKLSMVSDPLRSEVKLEPMTEAIEVVLKEPTLSPRYIAGYIRGIKVATSPDWLRTRLESIGQKSINNIVDATNFVMFALGQPLHAFDAARLNAHSNQFRITVRKAKGGEKMLALDAKEYEFSDNALLIVDAAGDTPLGHSSAMGAAIGIAGVKGGAPAGITDATRDIIIESANFNGVSVRKTAAALKLRTDASTRFEQGLSPELAAFGMSEVVKLILDIAGGELIGFADNYPILAEKKTASVSTARVNAVLGTALLDADVSDSFSRLGLAHAQQGDIFDVTAPFERLDITIPEDLIEEAARITGYDKVPTSELPPLPEKPEVNRNFFWAERIRDFLTNEGFSEVFTSVFSDTGERAVLNKVDSVKPFLRSSLVPGLEDALIRNARNKDLLGLMQVRLFEIGTVWQGGKESVSLGLAVEGLAHKATAEGANKGLSVSQYLVRLTEYLKNNVRVQEEKGEVLAVAFDDLISGLATPDAYDSLPASTTERYQPFSKYPFIVRDIALWTQAGTQPEDVLEVIHKHAGELLVRTDLFDTFEKDGKISYAFRLVFQSPDRTLFDADANERMESVQGAVAAQGWRVR